MTTSRKGAANVTAVVVSCITESLSMSDNVNVHIENRRNVPIAPVPNITMGEA